MYYFFKNVPSLSPHLASSGERSLSSEETSLSCSAHSSLPVVGFTVPRNMLLRLAALGSAATTRGAFAAVKGLINKLINKFCEHGRNV